MDVFYYWKNHEADLKAGRIGHFKSTEGKLKEFNEGFPDALWVFKTPKGRKGQLQLLARLRWSDRPVVRLKPEPGHPYMHYDPLDPQSVIFAGSDSDAAIDATTRWVAENFPKMAAANFQGAAGQEALRGTALMALQRLAAGFAREPFSSVAGVVAEA